MEEFSACFQDLNDPRIGNAGRHELPEILMISLCTTLCGGQTVVDMAEFGVVYVACLSQKYACVFLGQDTRAKALDPVMSDMKPPWKTTPGEIPFRRLSRRTDVLVS